MLFIDMEVRRGILFVRLHGVLNQETSILLKTQIDSLLHDQGLKYFVFNLEDVTSISKEGLTTLKDNYRQIEKLSGGMILCGLKDKMKYSILHHKELSNVLQSRDELCAFQIFKL